MNLKNLLFLASSVLLLQSCTGGVQSKQAVQNSHHSSSTHHDTTDHQSVGLTQAKLTVDPDIQPNQTVNLTIDIQDSSGKIVTKFEPFQEKLMHLVVVRDDLTVFGHLHPILKDNGQFEVQAKFPTSGNYTLFSDYKPQGQSEQISVMQVTVLGNQNPASQIDTNLTKPFGKTQVELSWNQPQLQTNQPVNFTFSLQDTTTKKPIEDLKPYLGEKGHLVILRQSQPLTEDNYIHAHALKDTTTGKVQFSTQFPQPGTYKLWGQFNRNGEIITADFWIEVVK